MQRIDYPVRHAYQTSNHNCSQTALATLLSYYGIDMPVEEIQAAVPVLKDERGEDAGSINQQIATWCLKQGWSVDLYTFDGLIIDYSWADLPPEKILERLRAVRDSREVKNIGKAFSKAYVQAYIDFLEAGGRLIIQTVVTSQLLYELLKKGPILAAVRYGVLHGTGRSRFTGVRESVYDDVNGRSGNHSVVVYGHTESGDFLIADPWKEPGKYQVAPERLLGAITAAGIECDNLIFQVTPPRVGRSTR